MARFYNLKVIYALQGTSARHKLWLVPGAKGERRPKVPKVPSQVRERSATDGRAGSDLDHDCCARDLCPLGYGENTPAYEAGEDGAP